MIQSNNGKLPYSKLLQIFYYETILIWLKNFMIFMLNVSGESGLQFCVASFKVNVSWVYYQSNYIHCCVSVPERLITM